jgi:hypothetical protein
VIVIVRPFREFVREAGGLIIVNLMRPFINRDYK